jgi:hypothetical protein
MPDRNSIETRLLKTLAAIALVAILGVLAILPFRLYERDIRHATVHAHRLSTVVQTAISRVVARGEDPTDLINRFQGAADVDIQLTRLMEGEVHPAAASGRGSSSLSGTRLSYVAAPISGLDDEVWLAQMDFDLSVMKRESVRLIIDLVLAVIIGSAVFSLIVFLVVRRAMIIPLRNFTETIEKRHPGDEHVSMPVFESSEMSDLVDAVERACTAHPPQVPPPQI